jgi:hypothetical protein
MFMISALVYIIVAGEPVIDAPLLFNRNGSFPTRQACDEFLKSQTFADEKFKLEQYVYAAAREVQPDIVPTIASTASCVPDPRL